MVTLGPTAEATLEGGEREGEERVTLWRSVLINEEGKSVFDIG